MKAPQVPITTETDGLAPRRLAWKVLEAVAAGAFADNALERELAKTNLAPLDRGLATELAYGAAMVLGGVAIFSLLSRLLLERVLSSKRVP